MNAIIKRSNQSPTLTTTSESRSSRPKRDFAPRTGAKASVVYVELFETPDPVDHHPNTQAVEHYIADREQDPRKAAALARARQRLADKTGGAVDLRTLRLRAGFSQKKLGDLVATSQARIARIEGGQEDPSMGFARRLANALGVDMNTLSEALIGEK